MSHAFNIHRDLPAAALACSALVAGVACGSAWAQTSDMETRPQWTSKIAQEKERSRKLEREKAEAQLREKEAAERARKAQAELELLKAEIAAARKPASAATAVAAPASSTPAGGGNASRSTNENASSRRMEPVLQVAGCSACGEMAVVPAGEFDMGSPMGEKGRSANEGPVRKGVKVASFEIGRTEVTQGQWKAVMGGANPSWLEVCGDACPVENVSWDMIAGPGGFLEKLHALTGKKYRLPTEAEWEYAARARSKTAFWWGDTITPAQANYDGREVYEGGGQKGEYRGRTVRADAFEANPWGLYNVHGNVSEWVQDGRHVNYEGAPADGREWTQGADLSQRVARGGDWHHLPRFLRAADRFTVPPGGSGINLGFRLARTL